MKKYNNIQIIDTDGKLVFEGSYTKLLNKFNNTDECNNYIEDCKDKGYDYSSRVTYYDFEYDNPNTNLSENWFEDITEKIGYEYSNELIEGIIKLSFKCINKIRVDKFNNCYLIVLPKQYDSLIIKQPFNRTIDNKYCDKLLKEVYYNINGKHNKTKLPKIRVAEFVNDWRTKIKYADYNEGYTFYYNTKPDINKLKLLLK